MIRGTNDRPLQRGSLKRGVTAGIEKGLTFGVKQKNVKMNSIVNLIGRYDHRQHELSDWRLELEQRFQLGQVDTDRAKITWCQLLIGAIGSSILASLEMGLPGKQPKRPYCLVLELALSEMRLGPHSNS